MVLYHKIELKSTYFFEKTPFSTVEKTKITTKKTVASFELYAKKPKRILEKLLQFKGKYGIIICVCVINTAYYTGGPLRRSA